MRHGDIGIGLDTVMSDEERRLAAVAHAAEGSLLHSQAFLDETRDTEMARDARHTSGLLFARAGDIDAAKAIAPEWPFELADANAEGEAYRATERHRLNVEEGVS